MKPHNANGECHACAVIALRHASGGTLDPNKTVSPAERLQSRTFVRLPDSSHRALFRRLAALTFRDEALRALDCATSTQMLAIPVDIEQDLRDAHRRAAAVKDVPPAFTARS